MLFINTKSILYITIFLVLLTTLRNISLLYFFIISSFIFYFFIKNFRNIAIFNRELIIFYAFLYYSFFVVFISFLYLYFEFILPFQGIPRLLLLPLISYILIYEITSEKQFRYILIICLIAYMLGSLSIIFQFIFFGPLDWLTYPSTRGGYPRYASVLGSLTVFGSVVGYALILISNNKLIKSNFIKIVFFTILVMGTIMSMSRVGIFFFLLSLIVLLIYLFIYENRNFFKYLIVLVIFSLAAYFFILTIENFQLVNKEGNIQVYDLKKYIDTAIALSIGEVFQLYSSSLNYIKDTNPITFDLALNDRLLKFFTNSFSYYYHDMSYGILLLITGVGLHGGAGVMGMPGASAHSGIGDLFFMGGPIYLLIFLILYTRIQLFLFKNIKLGLNNIFFISNLIFLVNAIFVAGSIFQPAISMIFWLSISYVYSQKRQNNITNN